MKTKILLLAILFVVVPFFIFASQCDSDAGLVGTWSTGAKTVWLDYGEGSELVPMRYDMIFTEDTFEWYTYVQLDSEWVLGSGSKGSYAYEGNIMTITLTQEYDYGTGQWSSSTETHSVQLTVSGDTFSYIEDRNEDEIYEDTVVFEDGVDMDDYDTDIKYIYYRQ